MLQGVSRGKVPHCANLVYAKKIALVGLNLNLKMIQLHWYNVNKI